MTSKINLSFFVLLGFLAFNTKALAQDENLDLFNQQLFFYSNLDHDFYDGEITMKNNETINGFVSLNHIDNQHYAVILSTDDGCIYIPNEDVSSVTLFNAHKGETTATKFVAIEGYDKLFRELYIKDEDSAIYDLIEAPYDSKIINDVYIKENNTLVSIDDFWTSGPKKDLINYINKRDNTDFKRKDFKSLNTLFAKL
ncbi:hypothetical protein ADIWIN_0478 [Winogradskyella psychrotolerans RS-3]|uniref:Secreted protein n=1 Tax=Winogradskyella psychrotolerans RS-3 TaxID=641526 RepID=S7VY61_9FLAO|nr:hypothetical protein [Winogradskyella psychrotolerans]EPR74377.1 hypothetical protein ADIWIN_0478 [Winogradskyella psychrotolerans RS-3]